MKRREKILATITGVLLLALLCVLLFSTQGGTLGQLRASRDKLTAEIKEKEIKAHAARKASAQLALWKKQSLPSNLDWARSAYQNWLLGLVAEVRLTDDTKFEPGQEQSRRGVYTVLPCKIGGRGSIQQLIAFLHKFYSAGHLQQIRRLSIKPIKGDRRLELSISIEAVSLPGSGRRDELSSQPSDRLGRESLREYMETISARNLFAAYETQRGPTGPSPADDTRLNSIVEAGGSKKVWLFVLSRKHTLKVGEGDTFPLGRSSEGRVLRIGNHDMEIEMDGKMLKVTLMQTLSQGTELPRKGEYSPEEMDSYLDDYISDYIDGSDGTTGKDTDENATEAQDTGDNTGEDTSETSDREPATTVISP